jgi:putative NADH-flavin reductase
VTAFVRRETPGLDSTARFRTFIGNILQSHSVEAAVRDHDAVIWAIGPRATDSAKNLCSEGTKNVLWAMQIAGVRRLICETAFGVTGSRLDGPYARIVRVVLRTRVRDKEIQERRIFASSVDWLIVRPTILTNGPATGKYRVGTDLRVGLFPRVSRADVADFLLQQVDDPTLHRQMVGITADWTSMFVDATGFHHGRPRTPIRRGRNVLGDEVAVPCRPAERRIASWMPASSARSRPGDPALVSLNTAPRARGRRVHRRERDARSHMQRRGVEPPALIGRPRPFGTAAGDPNAQKLR